MRNGNAARITPGLGLIFSMRSVHVVARRTSCMASTLERPIQATVMLHFEYGQDPQDTPQESQCWGEIFTSQKPIRSTGGFV